jgi:hypothetical protein
LRRKRPGEGSGAASATAMDEETKKKVEATVLDILRESFTEDKVRDAASERLGIDLSAPDLKPFIRGVLEGYLRSSSHRMTRSRMRRRRKAPEWRGRSNRRRRTMRKRRVEAAGRWSATARATSSSAA